MNHLAYDRVPHKNLQKNFDDNFWVGFWATLVACALVVITLFVFCVVVFKVNIKDQIAGKGDPAQRPVILGVMIGCVGLVLVAMMYYVRQSGGLIGVGADAIQTGERGNTVLTDGSWSG